MSCPTCPPQCQIRIIWHYSMVHRYARSRRQRDYPRPRFHPWSTMFRMQALWISLHRCQWLCSISKTFPTYGSPLQFRIIGNMCILAFTKIEEGKPLWSERRKEKLRHSCDQVPRIRMSISSLTVGTIDFFDTYCQVGHYSPFKRRFLLSASFVYTSISPFNS